MPMWSNTSTRLPSRACSITDRVTRSPTRQLDERSDVVFGVAALDERGRIAAHDRVVGNIPGHDGSGRDDCSVTDMDARHDCRVPADPDVVADLGVTTGRQVGDQIA